MMATDPSDSRGPRLLVHGERTEATKRRWVGRSGRRAVRELRTGIGGITTPDSTVLWRPLRGTPQWLGRWVSPRLRRKVKHVNLMRRRGTSNSTHSLGSVGGFSHTGALQAQRCVQDYGRGMVIFKSLIGSRISTCKSSITRCGNGSTRGELPTLLTLPFIRHARGPDAGCADA